MKEEEYERIGLGVSVEQRWSGFDYDVRCLERSEDLDDPAVARISGRGHSRRAGRVCTRNRRCQI